MTEIAEVSRYVGAGVLRKEDPELLTGQARYVDDIALPGMLWLGVVRSPYAHARIVRVDVSRAREAEGIAAAFAGADLAGEWASGLPCAWPIQDRVFPEESSVEARMPSHLPLATDKARYAGDGVAVVVGESRAAVKDALELVEVEYEPLEPVLDLERALDPSSPLVHEELGGNRAYTWGVGDREAAERVFAEAPITVRERYWHPRLIPNAIEPRGCVADPSPAMGELTLYSATQVPHVIKVTLALTLGISEAKLRVVAPDVGGGFGSKLNVYAEEALVLALARRLGRPVKWVAERTEDYVATIHGRGVIQDMEVAADEEGKLLGVRVGLLADFGAYYQLVTPGIPLLGAFLYHGVYDPQAYWFECTGVFTNRTPTDAYRGAGRPEATYAIERIMDTLGRRVGKDAAEIRRINLIPPFSEPRAAAGGLQFDSGNYEATLDRALELSGWDDLRARRAQPHGSKRLGVGVSTYIEMCGLAPSQVLSALKYAAGGWDAATIRCHPTGKVTVITGTSPHGQGHVTTWAQIAADELGVPFDDVEVLHGDTAVAPLGMDTYGSRSLSVGGTALWRAAQRVRAKARTIAAHELEVAPDDLEWVGGRFQVRGAPARTKSIAEIAFSAWTAHDLPEGVEPGLEETSVYDPPNFTFPSGAHVCAVEVDTETGAVEIVRYLAVDDCGNVINPVIVEGQVHGGVAQGIAEALFEEAVYDDDGQLLTNAMHAYRIPSAAELPRVETDRTVTPSSTNPLGVKGIGEAGTIATPPTVVNAVLDALAPLGVERIDLPLTPERVWRAIDDAKGGAS